MRRFLLHLFKLIFRDAVAPVSQLEPIRRRQAELAVLSDDELKAIGRRASELVEVFAVTAVVAARVLGFEMFDVQLQGALALANGKIAEMRVDRLTRACPVQQ